MVEDGTSYRGNGLGSENKAGMGKSCSEDNEEITLGEVGRGAVGSYQKVRRYHVAETDGGHFMEGQSGQAKEFIAR